MEESPNLPKSGRPSKLSNRDKRKLTIESKKIATKTAHSVSSPCNLQQTMSLNTVKQVWRKNHLFGRVAVKKTLLSNKQKSKRKLYASLHQS